ncbi:hypothetical protein [Streptomyces sp. F001]|uniref:hypothetical protein n=1 Tax=Streptomyces sp. F001 TaxID=1510026 RepID=UPI00101E70FC|nr:hypothetical protein [Streptomyces sp. F001]
MQKFDVLHIEIERHDWAGMVCGCGRSADHIPTDFISALQKSAPSRAGEGWADGHAYVQSNLMLPAAATTAMVMAALVSGVPDEHRRQLFIVLAALVNGEQDDLAEACLEIVQGGSWLLYEEIASGRNIDAASYAFEILQLIDDEAERLEFFRRAAAANLAPDLR